MRRFLNGTIAALATLCLAGLAQSAAGQNPGGSAEGKAMKNPVPVNAATIAAGKALYDRNCRFCHGNDAAGNGPMAPKDTHPANLIDDVWDRGSTDGEIFLAIQKGAGPKMEMKGYEGKLKDDQIWQVVNYLRSLHK